MGTDRRPTAARSSCSLLALAGAGLVLLWRAGRGWFLYDEWIWLGARKAVADRGDLLDALLLPHAEHLSLLPVAVYGGLYALVGLHSYVPYVAVLVALHLGVAVLLRLVMVRSGVGPWLAGGAAFVIVLLGVGAQNIVWAFQIGFVGAVVALLGQVLLADHAGGVDRRDVLGAALGVAAVASQSFGLLGVVLVASVLLVRRRWLAAAVAAFPAATLYLLWKVSFGSREIPLTTDVTQVFDVAIQEPGLGDKARFGAHLLGAAGRSLAPFPGGGLVAVLALVAAAVAVHRRPQAVVPVVLAAGAVVFAGLTGWNRAWLGVQGAEGGRYVYTVVVLLLPLAVLGVQRVLDTAMVRRLPGAAVAAVAGGCVLVVVAAGWRELDQELSVQVANGTVMRRQITAAATTPGYDQVDPDLPFSPQLSYSFGAAEVLPLEHDGALPDPGADAPLDRLDIAARLLTEVRTVPVGGDADLAVVAVTGAETAAGAPGCLLVQPAGGPARVELRAPSAPAGIGVVAAVEGSVQARAADAGLESWPVPLALPPGTLATVRVLTPVALVLELLDPVELCGAGAVAS